MPDDEHVIPLSRFSAVLARPRGGKRIEALLSQRDPAAAVAALPVQDLYYLIKEVGLADALALVELATPEQFQGFLDLDAWDRDLLDPGAVSQWLQALVAADSAKVTEIWRSLDPELAALVIARWTRVYDIIESDVPEEEEPPFYPTPDRFYIVKITATDPDTVHLVERLLDALYREDQELARHTLRTASSETFAYLEETSYRFRAARMQELGYADYYEALEVYRPIALPEVRIGEATAEAPGPSRLPAPMAEAAVRQGFLGRALALIVDPDEAARLEAALVTVLNRALSADRVDPGEAEAAAAGAARAAATLSVGLETVAQGDPQRAVEALRTISLTRLHRLGYSVALQLRKALEALGPLTERLDEPMRQVAAALREARPSFSRALDAPPAPGSRPFAALADVGQVTTLLAHLGREVRLLRSVLHVEPAALPPGATLGDAGRTAIVRVLIGEPPAARPLGVADVAHLVRVAFAGGKLTGSARQAAGAAFPREYAAVISGWLGQVEALAGGLDLSRPLDRRFLDGLLLE